MSDMTDIRTTVLTALPREAQQYTAYAEPVIEALVEREQIIIGRLTEVAQSYGLSDEDFHRVLITVGLVQPEPVAAPPSDPVMNQIEDLTHQARDLMQKMQALLEGR